MIKHIGSNTRIGCVLDVDMKPEVPWDKSVYGHSLTNHGSIWNLDGRYFDGNSFINCGNNNSLDITETLITKIRVKFDVLPSGAAVNYSQIFSKDSYLLFLHKTGKKIYLKIMDSGDNAHYSSFSESEINTTTFWNIAGTYNRATQKIYLNKTPYNPKNWSGNIKSTASSFIIGGSAGNHFSGFVRSISIYKQTKSINF